MSEATIISRKKAGELIKNYQEGKFFTVIFIKRGDGSRRTMNCRKGVTKGVKNVGIQYDLEKKGLVCVYDRHKQQHRMISLENIKDIKMDGKTYKVE